ncbi:TIGR03915 family putative DNA repair protein [Natranaerofaba carboxydovora]|uniref:TIGR03915 family putative DNA repair protein n=1 Tax=Natranaerofaba carboxydovora TaxID=2742683 RepID=UPI001F147EB3|nr:TIGR03915 family putative DNA repair protein [Natranaerofaba carboxydovora]UMZ74117.1 hypothetical protein ACONDI_01696 [Natranaerofaba carboxydovora]
MSLTIYYIYDGSFTGLLSALYYALNDKEKDKNKNIYILKENTQITQDLFAEYKKIKPDEDLANQISKKIKSDILSNTLSKIYYVFLSELDGVENIIFDYLKISFKEGSQIDEMLSNKTVDKLNKIRNKVSKERHRMLGFLRFKKLNMGIYYAPMEPDYDILTLIAPHFTKRLGDQSWVIHDVKREKCALYNQEDLIYTIENIPADKLVEDKEEQEFKNLWKKYFDHVTIKERKNLKLQQQFLPKKYWKYLPEKE